MTVKEELLAMMEHSNEEIHEFENRIEDSIEDIKIKVKDNVAVRDAYGNSLLSIGNDDKSAAFSKYTFSNDTLNWPLWLALYNESWVFRRAIDKPAQDEVRCGITLHNVDNISEILRRFKLYSDDLIQLFSWGALFGGSVAIALFKGFSEEDYAKPFNKEKAAKAKTMKLYVTDRWYGLAPDYSSIVKNMNDPDYGKPKYYKVTMSDGKTYKYHHDYVIRYEHRFAPKLVKNGMLQGWGYSEGSHILNELARDEKLKSSIQSLIDKSLIEVVKMSGMRGIFMGQDAQAEQQLRKRLEMVNWGRNYNSLTFLDKEDEYQMNNFSGLSGLSDLLQQNMWQIAAAVEMQGVLFGDMKQGFSNDSDALERYDETILSRCESYVRPVYEKLLTYIYTMLNIDTQPDFDFNSLLEKKHKLEHIENVNKVIDTCSKLLTDGVITVGQYAKSLKTYLEKDEIDFDLTDENIKKVEQEAEASAEDFDLDNDFNLNSNDDLNIDPADIKV